MGFTKRGVHRGFTKMTVNLNPVNPLATGLKNTTQTHTLTQV